MSRLAWLLSVGVHLTLLGVAAGASFGAAAPRSADAHFELAFAPGREAGAVPLPEAAPPREGESPPELDDEPVELPELPQPEPGLPLDPAVAELPVPAAAPASRPGPEPEAPCRAFAELARRVPAAAATSVEPAAEAPARVLAPRPGHDPPPAYPAAARRAGWQGRVVVRADVDREGNVSACTVIASSSWPVLDRAALDAVRRWRFDGGPGSVEVPVEFVLR